MKYVVNIASGFGTDDVSSYYCNERPTYEAETMPAFTQAEGDRSKSVHTGDVTQMFVVYTPTNGYHANRPARTPMERVISVVETD